MSREKLIEEAAKAIYENERRTIDPGWPAWEDCRDGSKESVLDAARDALAVFEKAHTPTDDEREALLKQFADRIFAAGLRAPDSTKAVIVFKEVAAGFHRCEVSEPSVCNGCHGLKGAHFSTCPEPSAEPLRDHAGWDMSLQFKPPRCEASDAQAEAEANRRWPHTPGEPDTASARSARRLSFRQGVAWARAASAATAEPLRDHAGWDMSLQFKPGQGEPSDAQAPRVHRTYPSTEGQQEDDGIGLLGGAPRW